jgi:hypothetical protein
VRTKAAASSAMSSMRVRGWPPDEAMPRPL